MKVVRGKNLPKITLTEGFSFMDEVMVEPSWQNQCGEKHLGTQEREPQNFPTNWNKFANGWDLFQLPSSSYEDDNSKKLYIQISLLYGVGIISGRSCDLKFSPGPCIDFLFWYPCICFFVDAWKKFNPNLLVVSFIRKMPYNPQEITNKNKSKSLKPGQPIRLLLFWWLSYQTNWKNLWSLRLWKLGWHQKSTVKRVVSYRIHVRQVYWPTFTIEINQMWCKHTIHGSYGYGELKSKFSTQSWWFQIYLCESGLWLFFRLLGDGSMGSPAYEKAHVWGWGPRPNTPFTIPETDRKSPWKLIVGRLLSNFTDAIFSFRCGN